MFFISLSNIHSVSEPEEEFMAEETTHVDDHQQTGIRIDVPVAFMLFTIVILFLRVLPRS